MRWIRYALLVYGMPMGLISLYWSISALITFDFERRWLIPLLLGNILMILNVYYIWANPPVIKSKA